MTLRYGTLEDIPALTALGEGFFAGLGYPDDDLDRDGIPQVLHDLVISPAGFVLVAEVGGAIVGAMLGLAHVPVFGRRLQASELGWFVAPDHRGSRDAVRMIAEFEAWARQRECVRVVLSRLMNMRPDAVGRLYERLGYAERESSFAKAL
jgi:GNAT superfamily N-acetyltransferase